MRCQHDDGISELSQQHVAECYVVEKRPLSESAERVRALQDGTAHPQARRHVPVHGTAGQELARVL